MKEAKQFPGLLVVCLLPDTATTYPVACCKIREELLQIIESGEKRPKKKRKEHKQKGNYTVSVLVEQSICTTSVKVDKAMAGLGWDKELP